ncbi:MAG: methionyl-tRNA formyltransferase [Clostridia bacterium]|nr:methionyl-tRNA formyltransferase [Clostridia bacterium]
MRILFMGTPDFALFSLRALVEAGEQVIGVVTQPDKPKGRGYTLTPPPVKVYASERGIPVYQPEKVKDGSFDGTLRELAPDVCVVAAYGKLLPESILTIPKYGCINIHGSLLPEYRGAAPMQRAIIDGKKMTGVTIQQMALGMDTGDILFMRETEIGENDNFEDIHDRLGVLGAEALLETLKLLREGKLDPVKQDESLATYAAKIEKADCVLDFSRPARELHNQIRGMSPFPLAFTRLPSGSMLKVTSAEVVAEDGEGPTGQVTSLDGGIVVQCGKGKIRLTGVLPEGKGRMPAADFVRGRKVAEGDILK